MFYTHGPFQHDFPSTANIFLPWRVWVCTRFKCPGMYLNNVALNGSKSFLVAGGLQLMHTLTQCQSLVSVDGLFCASSVLSFCDVKIKSQLRCFCLSTCVTLDSIISVRAKKKIIFSLVQTAKSRPKIFFVQFGVDNFPDRENEKHGHKQAEIADGKAKMASNLGCCLERNSLWWLLPVCGVWHFCMTPQNFWLKQ